MKISIAVTTFMVVGAGAAGASALTLPNPFLGSDTEFNITRAALTAVGLTAADYVGGGSGGGESAMAAGTPTQTTAPMSRMMKGGGVCGFQGGTNGSKATNASGIVIALDAVDILGSTTTSGSVACGGGPAGGNGILNSGGAISATTWKDALALIYGGKNNANGLVDCNQTARLNLVSNWSHIFQNSACASVATCSDGNHTAGTGTGIVSGTAALWHAYRRDETSGTSDVFSSILGISPSTSSSALNGFGTSPYCNALNWDTTTTTTACLPKAGGAFNPHGQFIGPGGVFDTDGVHKTPPPGLFGPLYGAQPDPTQTYKSQAIAFDVLPTDYQDNDPIRRACYGGTVQVLGHIGEDVCNIDGSLGLVIPLPDTNFVGTIADPLHAGSFLKQYPPAATGTQPCGPSAEGTPPNIYSCAAANITHPGECPNGDVLGNGACVYPIATQTTGQCTASNSTVASLINRTAAGNADGRVFNLFLTNGTTANGGVGLIQQNIPADGLSIDFAGAFNRIHQTDVAIAGATPCQMMDMTDQIGCLGQADPCSFGYAGDGGKAWNTHAVAPGGPTLPASSGIDAANVFGVYPNTASVQLLGESNEYPLSRKLFFNSLPGFSTVTLDELTLAKFEATGNSAGTTAWDNIVTSNDFFLLGAQAGPQTPGTGITSGVTGGTSNVQFCEDFDEAVVCNPSTTAASTLTNVNACPTNPSGIPTVGTDCGNGTREAFEECDDGKSNGITGDKCSATCRCTTFLNPTTGVCN
jgi:cysteine-rich repeat protein